MATSRLGRVYRHRPSHFDPRDKLHARWQSTPITTVKSVDLRATAGPVVDQGNMGCCTGCALSAAAYQVFELQQHIPLSSLFPYWCERVIEGSTRSDAGASLRDGCKVLQTKGICTEVLWPMKKGWRTAPKAQAYNDATKRRIKAYHAVYGLHQLQATLAAGELVILGITVWESFEDDNVATTGIVPMPDVNNEGILGGHAMCAVGFDMSKQWIVVKNSWSDQWGDKGYCYLPFGYVTLDQDMEMWACN